MKMLEIYQQYPLALSSGKGCYVIDSQGKKYLDFYGGHGVISIGHSHPKFVQAIKNQLDKLAFYSNAFQNPLQDELAKLLGKVSTYSDYALFLSNSGAEANENALKIASFITGRSKILALKGAFHGRSAGAVAVTDNTKIIAPFGAQLPVDFIPINDLSLLQRFLETNSYAAFIIEGIQGVNGVYEASTDFWKLARNLCSQTGTLLIADEIQSGYGRSGNFFAHQYHQIQADMVTVAKGMGNGFPVAGTLIHQTLDLKKGMLGTTFGGGQLACAAAISVLETISDENLMQHAEIQGAWLKKEVEQLTGVKTVRGRGLMLGIEFNVSAKAVRQMLLDEYHIITGFSEPDVLRILPPLTISSDESRVFTASLGKVLHQLTQSKFAKPLTTYQK
jgi:acetylornithine aminotransferase